MATSSEQNLDLVEQFVAVTGADRHVAESMLEACAGNLDLAVGMHMDGGAGERPGPSGARVDSEATASGIRPCNNEDEEDDVRAPIPQKTEMLVDDDTSKFAFRTRRPRRAARSVFDGFRDFKAEGLYEDDLKGEASSKKRNLEDLFRPPVDITHKGTFDTARKFGSSENRWLLINVQNVQEFSCQTLNRDVWSCQAVRDVIKDNFIFWQIYNDSEEGVRFMQFYKVDQWPHVAVIDPFTGENQVVWHKISDGAVFCELAKEFLAIQHVPDNSQCPSPAKRSKREPSIVDASEQDQMEAAIQASLNADKIPAGSPQYVQDSDSEADVIEDSGDEVETFSDSEDDVIVSSPLISKKSSSQNGQAKKASPTSPPSQYSSSSHSRAATSSLSDKQTTTKSPRKDNLSRCKNMSTTTTSLCSYSPHRRAPEEAGSSSSNGSGSNIWPPSVVSSSSTSRRLSSSPLRVDVDSLDTPCAALPISHSSLGALEADRLSASRDGCCEEEENSMSDWKQLWGDTSDPFSKIILRLPDNKREQIELPCSSCLKALIVRCSSMGYPPEKFELVTNFPRRKLSEMCEEKTLKEVGLYPQETVFVQDL